jgi:hypothetical protein
MHWTTYCHIPGDAPEKPTRPQARQANSAPDAACSTLQDYNQSKVTLLLRRPPSRRL